MLNVLAGVSRNPGDTSSLCIRVYHTASGNGSPSVLLFGGERPLKQTQGWRGLLGRCRKGAARCWECGTDTHTHTHTPPPLFFARRPVPSSLPLSLPRPLRALLRYPRLPASPSSSRSRG
eukprot:614512-Rhodomonas_salina.4